MHKRLTVRALVASLSIFVLGLLWAMPALASHDGDDDGNDDRTITIEVDCHSVDVESEKRISEVTVYFVDGTSEEFRPGDEDGDDDGDDDDDDADDDDDPDDSDEDEDDGDDGENGSEDGRQFFETFEETVASATARSGGTEAEDSAEDCETTDDSSADDDADDSGSDDGDDGDDSDDADAQESGTTSGDNDGSTRSSGGGSTGDGTTATTTRSTADGGGSDGASSAVAQDTGDRVVDASRATAAATGDDADFGFSGGSADVLASLAVVNGAKICPSGPYKGMPYVTIKDCGEAVLAAHLAATGASDLWVVAVVGGALMGAGLLILLRDRRYAS